VKRRVVYGLPAFLSLPWAEIWESPDRAVFGASAYRMKKACVHEGDHMPPKPFCTDCKTLGDDSNAIIRPSRWVFWSMLLGFALGAAFTVAAFHLHGEARRLIGAIGGTGLFCGLIQLFHYIEDTVRGHRYYVLRDTKGHDHVHERLYAGGYVAGVEGHMNDPVFVQGHILVVWSGGWHRKHEVLYCRNKYRHPSNPKAKPEPDDYSTSEWRITRVQLDAQHPRIWYTDGTNVIYMDTPCDVLTRIEEGGYGRLLERVKIAEAVRDELGILVVGVLEKIAEMRDTIGRSKHAQAIREHLEDGLQVIFEEDAHGIETRHRWCTTYQERKRVLESAQLTPLPS
jgi:hypothetical protein